MVKEYGLLLDRAIRAMFRRKVAELVDAEYPLQDVIASTIRLGSDRPRRLAHISV